MLHSLSRYNFCCCLHFFFHKQTRAHDAVVLAMLGTVLSVIGLLGVGVLIVAAHMERSLVLDTKLSMKVAVAPVTTT